jgi:hypothetical protein
VTGGAAVYKDRRRRRLLAPQLLDAGADGLEIVSCSGP